MDGLPSSPKAYRTEREEEEILRPDNALSVWGCVHCSTATGCQNKATEDSQNPYVFLLKTFWLMSLVSHIGTWDLLIITTHPVSAPFQNFTACIFLSPWFSSSSLSLSPRCRSVHASRCINRLSSLSSFSPEHTQQQNALKNVLDPR